MFVLLNNFWSLFIGTSLAIQQLKLHASSAGDSGLIPGQGIKIPHALRYAPHQKKFINHLGPCNILHLQVFEKATA